MSSEVKGYYTNVASGWCWLLRTTVYPWYGRLDKARAYTAVRLRHATASPHFHRPMINNRANIPTMSLTLYFSSHFWSVLLHLHRSVFRLSLALFLRLLFALSPSLYVWSLLLRQMAVRNVAKLFRKTVIFHVAWNSVGYAYLQGSLIKFFIAAFY